MSQCNVGTGIHFERREVAQHSLHLVDDFLGVPNQLWPVSVDQEMLDRAKILSTPSKLCNCTNSHKFLANTSLSAGLAATVAKASLPRPPPPIDRMTRRFGCCAL